MVPVRRQTPSGISEAIRDACLAGYLADLQTWLNQTRPAPLRPPPAAAASPAGPDEVPRRRSSKQTQVS